MSLLVILLAVLCLAYGNGANDNFKGVATLFGSGTLSYRRALTWATVTTLCGSLTAMLLAGKLLNAFSGKGLVDASLVSSLDYAAAVALGAGITTLLATRLGMPVSTTHALVGSLAGAGAAAGSHIALTQLGGAFFLPLLVSPILAIAATAVAYWVFRSAGRGLGIRAETCLCVGNRVVEVVPATDGSLACRKAAELAVELGDEVTCRSRFHGSILGVRAGALLDQLHVLSAGAVSFARGLNDTPKIAALLLVLPLLGGFSGVLMVGIAIAIGGVVSARRVAETMSRKITEINPGQGLTANLATSALVIGASRLGMPVSTTHVSCGALFGIGAATGRGHLRMIGTILGAWLLTLPCGAACGAASYMAVRWLGQG